MKKQTHAMREPAGVRFSLVILHIQAMRLIPSVSVTMQAGVFVGIEMRLVALVGLNRERVVHPYSEIEIASALDIHLRRSDRHDRRRIGSIHNG